MRVQTVKTLGADAREALFLGIDALRNGNIKPTQANLLHRCANDYVKLAKHQVAQTKKLGHEPATPAGVPDLRVVSGLLEWDKWAAAIAEAKRIHAVMKPILEKAKGEPKAK